MFTGSAPAAPQAQTAASRASVRSVSEPPATVPGVLVLRVHGTARAVTVYASKGRSVVRGTVRIARRVAVRKGRITAHVPAALPAGLWFAVVCPAGAKTRCAASHRGMFKPLTKLAAPVRVLPVLDAARAVTAALGPGGGSVSAVAANGTTFRLDVPAGSVREATQITLTPLSSPTTAKWFGTLVGGVQLAPEGLLLMRGATLTVTPKGRVPASRWVPVGFTGQGEDVHLVPVGRNRAAIEIPLAHFSGFGVGNSSSGGAGAPTGGTAGGWFEGQLLDLMKQLQEGKTSQQDFNEAVKQVFDE